MNGTENGLSLVKVVSVLLAKSLHLRSQALKIRMRCSLVLKGISKFISNRMRKLTKKEKSLRT